MGDRVTWPDFNLFEALELLEALKPGALSEFNPEMLAYRNRVAGLNGVRERIAQPRLKFTAYISKFS
jgi:hypothetical protein